MDFDDISRVCNKFCELLKFSSEVFTIDCMETSDCCELQINADKVLKCSIIVTNGSIKILYNTEFDEKKLYTVSYSSTVSLLYYLAVIYYTQINLYNEEISDETISVRFSFLDLLSILLIDDVDNWRSLFKVLCDNLNIRYYEDDDGFDIGQCKVKYKGGYLNCNNVQIYVDDTSLAKFVEAVFNVVEYVAVLNKTQNDLYKEITVTEPLEPMMPMDSPMGGFDDLDFGDGSEFGDEDISFDEGESSDFSESVEETTTINTNPTSPEDLSPDFSVPEGL